MPRENYNSNGKMYLIHGSSLRIGLKHLIVADCSLMGGRFGSVSV